MMVAAISATPNPKTSSRGGINNTNTQNPTRPPLLPSEGGDNVVPPPPRRPKSREVTSRYLTASSPSVSSSAAAPSVSSTPRRCPSPFVSRTAPSTPMPSSSFAKRSQSVERRRPATPRPGTPGNAADATSAAAKMLITSSTRSYSVSFQGESFALKVSKAKPAPTPNATPIVRRGTPEKRRATPSRGVRGDGAGSGADQSENMKIIDQHRWPGRLRQPDSLSRSMDCTDDRKRSGVSGNVVRSLNNSLIGDRVRSSTDGRLQSDLGNVELKKGVEHITDGNSATGTSVIPSDCAASDAESVSSGSTSGAQEFTGTLHGRGGQRGVMVPARVWQETNNRLRQGRLPEPTSPLSKSMGMRTPAFPKQSLPKKVNDTPVLSPRSIPTNRGMSSPLRGSVRPASPSKFASTSVSTSLRGASPSRSRTGPGTLGSNTSSLPSILTFAADIRRGKIGDNRIDEAHLLRLLYNRLLQWRYVNASVDAAQYIQKMTEEKVLYEAWLTIAKLRNSVRDKKIMMQMLKKNMKLTSILKEQIIYLEDWANMDKDHSNSLSGTVEAFKASTLRLPVVGGARADVQNVKDAIGSAVDVMQVMASSICSLLPKIYPPFYVPMMVIGLRNYSMEQDLAIPFETNLLPPVTGSNIDGFPEPDRFSHKSGVAREKVDGMNSFASELANIASQERALLNHCQDLMSTVVSMQVKDCSLKTHILQLNRIRSTAEV